MAPALAFLLAGVPLAALLERLGFFDAVVSSIAARVGSVSVLVLWVLAAATTVVLNLDTTVVLLTPLYLRLARRAGADPVAVALVPLLLASLASSVLPVSNLTTLIAAQQFHLGAAQVAGHLALPSLAASTAGWLVYRRRHPTTLACPPGPAPDRTGAAHRRRGGGRRAGRLHRGRRAGRTGLVGGAGRRCRPGRGHPVAAVADPAGGHRAPAWPRWPRRWPWSSPAAGWSGC